MNNLSSMKSSFIKLMKHGLLIVLFLAATSCNHFTPYTVKSNGNVKGNSMITSLFFKKVKIVSCENIEEYSINSNFLEKIAKEDQQERINLHDYASFANNDLISRDLERRKQVAIIFAKGCLKSARDYANAALVFQHGTNAEHFYQAYLWAKKSLTLGDTSQRILMADAIDRYLISMGYKQIFGTQAQLKNIENTKACFCLQPIEKHFPDALRLKYFGKTKKDQFAWLEELNKGKSCPNQECSEQLKPVNKELLREMCILNN